MSKQKKERVIQFTLSNYDINQLLDLYEYIVNGWRIFESKSHPPKNEGDVGTTSLFLKQEVKDALEK